jgi:hypothetical protein
MSKVVGTPNNPDQEVEEDDQSATNSEPKSKKNSKKSKSRGKKATGDQKLEGAAFINHVLKKGGKNGTSILIAELTEDVLQDRLKLLQTELEEYKKRCAR